MLYLLYFNWNIAKINVSMALLSFHIHASVAQDMATAANVTELLEIRYLHINNTFITAANTSHSLSIYIYIEYNTFFKHIIFLRKLYKITVLHNDLRSITMYTAPLFKFEPTGPSLHGYFP